MITDAINGAHHRHNMPETFARNSRGQNIDSLAFLCDPVDELINDEDRDHDNRTIFIHAPDSPRFLLIRYSGSASISTSTIRLILKSSKDSL